MDSKLTSNQIKEIVNVYGYTILPESAEILSKLLNLGGDFDYTSDDFEFGLYDPSTTLKDLSSNTNIEQKGENFELKEFSFLNDYDHGDFKSLNWQFQMAGKLFVTNNISGDYWLLDLASGGAHLDYWSHSDYSIVGFNVITLEELYEIVSKKSPIQAKKFNCYKDAYAESDQRASFDLIDLAGINIADSVLDEGYYPLEDEEELRKKYPLTFLFSYKYFGLNSEYNKLKSTAKIPEGMKGLAGIIDAMKSYYHFV